MSAAAPNGKGESGPSLSLLIKLLKLTTSSTDAEALLAVRKANEQLTKHFGGDWEALLRSKVTVILDPFAESEHRAAPTAPPPPPDNRYTPQPPTYGAAPPPPDYTQPQPWKVQRKPAPKPKPQPTVKGPQRGRIIPNQFSKGCFICSNNVPTGTGFAIVDTEWNKRAGKWETICQPCFDNGGTAPAFRPAPQPSAATGGIGDLS